MGPDFGPGGPGGPDFGPGGPHYFHHGHPPFAMDLWPAVGGLLMMLAIVGSSPYDAERHTALRKALRKLSDLERRTGWRLPAPAALALEERARGALAA